MNLLSVWGSSVQSEMEGVDILCWGSGKQVVLASVTVSIFPRLRASQACGCMFYECLYKHMAGEHSVVTGRGDKA